MAEGDFIESLRLLVQNPEGVLGQDLVWVAGREVNGYAVIVYEERDFGPILGCRYDLVRYKSMFDPHLTQADLARIVYIDDLCSPAGQGINKSVDWANGLVDKPEQVKWLHESEAR